MEADVCDLADALALLRSPFVLDDCSLPEGVAALVVDDDAWDASGLADPGLRQALRAVPTVTVAIVRAPELSPEAAVLVDAFDVVLSVGPDPEDRWVVPGPDHLDDMYVELVMAVEQNPKASLAMAQLLRSRAYEDVPTGLFAESTVYGLLQAGSEFKGWLKEWKAEGRPKRPRERQAPVLVEYEGLIATVTLNRPHVRNAFNRAMRDALADALRGATYGTAALVVLRGAGPSFCAGGDLSEFGTTRDPTDAHVIRSTRSVPYWAWRCADWLRAEVHGAAVGAGIELAAYAARVAAAPDAFFLLPEVAMGLVPGSGGTVSIPRRIGPHRTAFFALSGARLDVPTARRWGLVDEVVEDLPVLR
jgi:enoyl-CoA hydratase/carnithine racemase